MSNPVKGPITAAEILRMKASGRRIAALTAYDASFARLLDEAGVDLILVGDSLGMVIQGHATTLPVTLEDVLYHTRACARAVRRALLVSDLPFMSYHESPEQALRAAGRCIKEAGAAAVKLEGGQEIASSIFKLTAVGIPVMGHVGMQPQRVHAYGGYAIQGRESAQAERIFQDAIAVAEAGAFAVVLEKIPRPLASRITERLTIPTIGIASGASCDGQILVGYDMLGIADQFNFKFVRRYLELGRDIREAVKRYNEDIRNGSFPSENESFE